MPIELQGGAPIDWTVPASAQFVVDRANIYSESLKDKLLKEEINEILASTYGGHKNLQETKDNLEHNRQIVIRKYEGKRINEEFHIGDEVLISTKDLETSQFTSMDSVKLAPRFIGPYPVIKVINTNAYKLRLPRFMQLHPVFNISQLKLYVEPLGMPDRNLSKTTSYVSRYRNQPIKEIRGMRRINRRDHYLVHWEDTPDSEDTWIPTNQLENVHDLMLK